MVLIELVQLRGVDKLPKVTVNKFHDKENAWAIAELVGIIIVLCEDVNNLTCEHIIFLFPQLPQNWNLSEDVLAFVETIKISFNIFDGHIFLGFPVDCFDNFAERPFSQDVKQFVLAIYNFPLRA